MELALVTGVYSTAGSFTKALCWQSVRRELVVWEGGPGIKDKHRSLVRGISDRGDLGLINGAPFS